MPKSPASDDSIDSVSSGSAPSGSAPTGSRSTGPRPATAHDAAGAEDAARQPHEVPFTPPGLTRENWDRAAARLLAKMIGEFAYEEIIEPVPDPSGSGPDDEGLRYTLPIDAEGVLTFRARRGAYGSWRVDPASVECDGRPFTDPLAFLARARNLLGLDGATLGHLLREMSVTLAGDTRLDGTALTAAELADLGYAELEGHQTGHPWLVLNKGRIGFSAGDADRWAPEARRLVRLPWIAVRTGLAAYRGVAGLDRAEDLYLRELDEANRESFADALRARGLDPAAYLFLPVHPWQWDEVLLPLYAPAVADGRIVPLPSDGDLRLPQQSIRTFVNVDRPDRHTVKLPLSILNTLVWRGLPTERTLAAPAVTAWVHGLRDADPFLRDECRVVLLGEVASVTVEHPLYDHLAEVPYQYKELLGAIWREPLQPRLDAGERARTLASLLHTDPQGRAFTAELVARSGLAPTVWLQRLFAALLPPLLHFLYRYGTVFSPHGENAIVVYDDHDVPVRLAIKDFVDDVNVSAQPVPEHASMPEDVRRILLTEEPGFLTQFIHAGLFVGVFRYLAPLCEEQLNVPEAEFFSLVRAEILRYQARFPGLKERYETFDLLTARIERLCLNRNRLHLDGYRDRPERPHAAVHGTVPNPLATA
ncbi:rhizobactin siderophore biosynthesis protein rhbF [Streptomyces pristinaespiralis ATCC 25486]|uniref:Rhizobactin siderophore biosynthesis protein rhbF n=2 Tax=Streptomyces pristinaespiralis TaxID=38300 RepID=B5H8X0_STRE2|nr:siderophore biosynthesis protein IucA [Streptomyces pristinaespiralis]EDY63281.1 rhizobactin siderophore biosynthesis protein rhbF [Streptomyces pristinaespiralis ATCC 25486]